MTPLTLIASCSSRQRVHVGGDADVGAHPDRLRAQRLGRLGDAFRVLTGDGDARAVLDEELGGRAADAGGAAGDEGGLAFESLHAVLLDRMGWSVIGISIPIGI